MSKTSSTLYVNGRPKKKKSSDWSHAMLPGCMISTLRFREAPEGIPDSCFQSLQIIKP